MTTRTRFPSGIVGSGPSSMTMNVSVPTGCLTSAGDPSGSPVSAVKAYGVTPRGSLRGHEGDAELGTHIVGITSFHLPNNSGQSSRAQSILQSRLLTRNPRCGNLKSNMYEHLLVALDGSSTAEQVLEHTEALARAFGSIVTLFRATVSAEAVISQTSGASPSIGEVGPLIDP